ncbi:acyltransferase family protein [Pseudarthrobacter oxydans]|uniref:acyltransferase family protein n=1 Tax=Pseudarthrobacter oxydans TaxID=1671 RepID=UPI00381A5FBB
MDTLRGLAILLVVFWHAPAVPALFGYQLPQGLAALNDFFLPFRMPTLMFLSGMLLERSMRKDWRTYYLGKVQSLVWPYLLWAALHMVLYGGSLQLSNPRSWVATGYLWFLFYITCYYFIAPLLKRLPPWLTPLAMLLASIPQDDGMPKKFLYFGAFFFCGHLVMRYQGLLEHALKPSIALAAGVVGVGLGVASMWFGDYLAYRGEFAPFSLLGILSMIYVSRLSAGYAWTRLIAFVGRNSLIYYASHFPLILLVKHGAEFIGVHNIWAIAVPGFVLSMAVGTGLAYLRNDPPVRWLFTAPLIHRLTPPRSKKAALVS